MARWRWLLIVVLVGGLIAFPPGGIDRSPAQTSTDWSKVITTTGAPGGFNTNLKTGECRYTAPNGTWQTAVTIPAPTATAIPGKSNQRITWEPRLYQVIVPGREYVRSGAVQSVATSGGSTIFAAETLAGLAQGPAYVTGGRLAWFSNEIEIGAVELYYHRHSVYRDQQPPFGTRLTTCSPIAPAEVSLSTYRTTVNITVHLSGRYFPVSTPVAVTWKGARIADAMSDANGNVFASIKVPAAPAGDYRLGFDAGSIWKTAQTLILAPRVKVIPGTAERGDEVRISLRGFAKKESVRIRWLIDGRWVEVGWVKTSNTGSASLTIPVPNEVGTGRNSVRGDGPGARAQTNAFNVVGEPEVTLAEDPAATPEAPLPATPEPTVDTGPATPAPVTDPSPPVGTPEPQETGPESDLPEGSEAEHPEDAA